jgi:hypothetical protein
VPYLRLAQAYYEYGSRSTRVSNQPQAARFLLLQHEKSVPPTEGATPRGTPEDSGVGYESYLIYIYNIIIYKTRVSFQCIFIITCPSCVTAKLQLQ